MKIMYYVNKKGVKCLSIANLDLHLNFEWYDMIKKGEKPEEYRRICDHWISRLCAHKFPEAIVTNLNIVRPKFTHVTLWRGYTREFMMFRPKLLRVGEGNPKWGAPKGEKVFIIELGELLKTEQGCVYKIDPNNPHNREIERSLGKLKQTNGDDTL